ncbi:PREDICTED: uncharacterized protein LOC109126312 [Camelina sativa]|uniref:Uncharacterized protein LOC109126312 n=1 Tax=Camelina sativa TaxID=90675 RepID=A0ABM1QEZ1_CAMSA|nr:PREDICTED: uncharacterized protein LOC109126312 [Camelina sativa]
MAHSLIKCDLGNGERASFWYDAWCHLGPLINLTGNDGPVRFGISSQLSVADACEGNIWHLPSPRSDQERELHSFLDMFFSIRPDAGIDCYKERSNIKEWSSLIWFKGATPKHAFIMWVAYLHRLPTRDRLHAWGISTPTSCCICSASEESHVHLFLRYPFSKQVWSRVQSHLRLRPLAFHTWPSLLAWTKIKSDLAPPIIRKLACQAVVYHLWKLRNTILHNQVLFSPTAAYQEIVTEIRNTIDARKS